MSVGSGCRKQKGDECFKWIQRSQICCVCCTYPYSYPMCPLIICLLDGTCLTFSPGNYSGVPLSCLLLLYHYQ